MTCGELINILMNKVQSKDENNEESENDSKRMNRSHQSAPYTPSAVSKQYSYKTAAPPPSWSTPGALKTPGSMSKETTSKPRPPKSQTDLAKSGIQVGKTKVFLRHSAFESFERLRSQEQGKAAVKLNSIFRMYLARVAYVHVRNVVRHSMYDLQRFENEYKETKEQEYGDDERMNRFIKIRNSYNGEMPSLVDVWATQIRASIHNPVPRSEWGKQSPSGNFKWMLVDGLWVKNRQPEAI